MSLPALATSTKPVRMDTAQRGGAPCWIRAIGSGRRGASGRTLDDSPGVAEKSPTKPSGRATRNGSRRPLGPGQPTRTPRSQRRGRQADADPQCDRSRIPAAVEAPAISGGMLDMNGTDVLISPPDEKPWTMRRTTSAVGAAAPSPTRRDQTYSARRACHQQDHGGQQPAATVSIRARPYEQCPTGRARNDVANTAKIATTPRSSAPAGSRTARRGPRRTLRRLRSHTTRSRWRNTPARAQLANRPRHGRPQLTHHLAPAFASRVRSCAPGKRCRPTYPSVMPHASPPPVRQRPGQGVRSSRVVARG